MKNFEKKIIIRFGSIGDLTTSSAKLDVDTEIYFCKSPASFFQFNSQKNIPSWFYDLTKFLNIDDRVFYASSYKVLKLLWRSEKRVLCIFDVQSDSGQLLNFVYNIFYVFSLFRNNISVTKFWNGSQYLNRQEYKLKTFKSQVAQSCGQHVKKIGIFYDSKQLANNLSIETVNLVIDKVISTFGTSTIVSVYGASSLNDTDKRAINLTGKLSFSELLYHIQDIDLAITCDSGPMHLCVSKNIPTISFFSLRQNYTNWVPKAPCHIPIALDFLECAGCSKAKCPIGKNVCVNNENNIKTFEAIVEYLQ